MIKQNLKSPFAGMTARQIKSLTKSDFKKMEVQIARKRFNQVFLDILLKREIDNIK